MVCGGVDVCDFGVIGLFVRRGMGYVDYNMYEFWQFFLVPRMCKMNVDVSLLPSN